MTPDETTDEREHAVELLQQLGLKEYEAECYVALARLPSGTAKQISEHSEVPRTRVYDAARVLEAQGLIEVQHSSPQQFRAVPVEEAVETLRRRYENRFDTLTDAIDDLSAPTDEEAEEVHEVWALSNADAIANRTRKLIDTAEREVVLVVGDESALSEELYETLTDAADRGVTLLVGTSDEAVKSRVGGSVGDAEVFVSGLDWLNGSAAAVDGHESIIGRILMVDRSRLLVSSLDRETGTERAVFGQGFSNGLVVIARRLLATGLVQPREPQ